nr:synthetic fusion protein [unidentified cloning vector]
MQTQKPTLELLTCEGPYRRNSSSPGDPLESTCSPSLSMISCQT